VPGSIPSTKLRNLRSSSRCQVTLRRTLPLRAFAVFDVTSLEASSSVCVLAVLVCTSNMGGSAGAGGIVGDGRGDGGGAVDSNVPAMNPIGDGTPLWGVTGREKSSREEHALGVVATE